MTMGGFGGQVIFMPGHRAAAEVVNIDMTDGRGPRPWIKVTQSGRLVGYFDSVEDLAGHGIDVAALEV